MFDPLGSIVVELRDDADVAAWADVIRGGQLAPTDTVTREDGWKRIVQVISTGHPIRHAQLPVATAALAVKCWGTSEADAAAGAGLVSDALHARLPRLGTGGFAIYASHDTGGLGPDIDPHTQQPSESLTVELLVSTMVATG